VHPWSELLTTTMEHDPSEINSCTSSQVIPYFYRTQRFITLSQAQTIHPYLSLLDPGLNIPSCFCKINFNLMLLSLPGSAKYYYFLFCAPSSIVFLTISYHIIYFRGPVQDCKSIWIWKMVTLIQSVQNNYNIWYINYLT